MLLLTNCIWQALFSAVACDEAHDWVRRINVLMISGLHPLSWKNRCLLVTIGFFQNIKRVSLVHDNRSALNEMHIHQENHWNDIIFYWYQSYHWYQWTIRITLFPARPREKIIYVTLMRCIFTNRTIGMASFSIGTNRTISTNGPSELPCTQLDHMENILIPLMRCIFTNRTIWMTCFSVGTTCIIGTNGPLELPCTQLDHMENNLGPLNEMHIHQ